MKKIARIILHKLMMYPSHNLFIKKHIENPIIFIANTVAFSDNIFAFFKKNILKNKRTYKLITTIVLFITIIYSIGYSKSLNVIDYLRFNEQLLISRMSNINNKLMAETSEKLNYKNKLYNIIYSDDYMRYIVYKEANIFIPRGANMQHLRVMFQETDKNEIPYSIIFRLINKESGYINGLTSNKGAFGYMQVMPETKKIYRKKLHTQNLTPVDENITIGCAMLKEMYTLYKSEKNNEVKAWKLALAAYNAGPGNVKKYGGIPPFTETTDYVKYITQGLEINNLKTN